jgi:hypothetical protein
MAGLSQNVSDPNQPQAAKEAERLDAQSAADWIQSLDVQPITKKYFTTTFVGIYVRARFRCSIVPQLADYSTTERAEFACDRRDD